MFHGIKQHITSSYLRFIFRETTGGATKKRVTVSNYAVNWLPLFAVGVIMGYMGPAICALRCELERAVFGPLTVASLCFDGVSHQVDGSTGVLPQIPIQAERAVSS